MRLIVTKENADGSFDDVGMNNRTVVSGYKTLPNAIKYGVMPYGNGKRCRVEVYRGTTFAKPIDTFICETY